MFLITFEPKFHLFFPKIIYFPEFIKHKPKKNVCSMQTYKTSNIKKNISKERGGVIIFHENIHPCIKKIIIQIIFDVELFCEILSNL